MSLMTDEQLQQLLTNGGSVHPGRDHVPVVKLFMTDERDRWLLTGLDPDDPDTAFGLCDDGCGHTWLGRVSLAWLASIGGRRVEPVVRDTCFVARHPISVYARAAAVAGAITEDPELLAAASPDVFPALRGQHGPQP